MPVKRPTKTPPLAGWIVATKLLKRWLRPDVSHTKSRRPPEEVRRGLEFPRY